MKAKVARGVLSGNYWTVEVCYRCDGQSVITLLHDRHFDEYDRLGAKQTWEQIMRPLPPDCAEAVRESVLGVGNAPVINWHMPDVGRLTLARWQDGYWFHALNRCYEVCLQTGVVVFEPFRSGALEEVRRTGNPWAVEAYHVARHLDALAGVAVRSAHDEVLNQGFLLLANEWLSESRLGD